MSHWRTQKKAQMQAIVLAAIAEGSSDVQAARLVGVSPYTVRTWRITAEARKRAGEPKPEPKANITPAPYARGFVWGAGRV